MIKMTQIRGKKAVAVAAAPLEKEQRKKEEKKKNIVQAQHAQHNVKGRRTKTSADAKQRGDNAQQCQSREPESARQGFKSNKTREVRTEKQVGQTSGQRRQRNTGENMIA